MIIVKCFVALPCGAPFRALCVQEVLIIASLLVLQISTLGRRHSQHQHVSGFGVFVVCQVTQPLKRKLFADIARGILHKNVSLGLSV